VVYNSSKRKQGSDYVSAGAGSQFGYQEGEETLKLLLFVSGCQHHYQSKACIAYGLSISNQDGHKKYIANISNNTMNTNVKKIINKILMPCETWLIAHMQAKIHLHCLTQVKCHVSIKTKELADGCVLDLSVLIALAQGHISYTYRVLSLYQQNRWNGFFKVLEHLWSSLLLMSTQCIYEIDICVILVHFMKRVCGYFFIKYEDRSTVKRMYRTWFVVLLYQLNFQQFQAIWGGYKWC